MLQQGLTAKVTIDIMPEHTAEAMGSGSLPVFATPALVALMERAACECIAGLLDNGKTSVGTRIEVQHIAATAIGKKVTAAATLTEIDGRRIAFEIVAFEGEKKIGRAGHERFIVDEEQFMARLGG